MLELVEINADKQWLYIRGNSNKPILLFLHGGPASTTMFMNDVFLPLETDFLLVDYDQRGAGRSFSSKTPRDSFHVQQYVEDVKEVVLHLRKRFQTKEKIYVAGHSWGSVIGLLCVHQYPQLFHAYLGISQVIHTRKSEELAYQHLLRESGQRDNQRVSRKLAKIGPPPYQTLRSYTTFRLILDKYAGFHFNKPTNIWEDYLRELLRSNQYSLFDSLKWMRGLAISLRYLHQEIATLNLFSRIEKVEVPLYFLMGENDYISPVSLLEEFAKHVQAPHMDVIIVPESAHNVHLDNPEILKQICIQMKNNPKEKGGESVE